MPRKRAAQGAPEAAPATASIDDFRLEEFLPYQLSVTANRVSRKFARRYAERFGISIPEWRVLSVVGRFGAISPSAVSEWTGMDKVKVSRAAAGLVDRGLARQVTDARDGRARVLSLTRKGSQTYAAIVPLARQLEASLAASMSKADWAALRRILGQLSAHLLTEDGPDPAGGPD